MSHLRPYYIMVEDVAVLEEYAINAQVESEGDGRGERITTFSYRDRRTE